MYKNLLRIFILIIFIYGLDYIVGSYLKKIYFQPHVGKYHDQTYALDSAKADIIIVGSSRAARSYVSQELEDSLHMTCYNAGREGSFFLFSMLP